MSEEKRKFGGIKDVAIGRSDLFRLHPDDLHIKEGWNSRDFDDPANVEHIDMLARSIAEVGVKEPLTVYWDDGKAWVSDGECRLRAARRAIELYGAEVKTIPVKTEGQYASEADRVFSQIVRNSGKPHTPFEQSKTFKRLIDLGWTEKEIADKAGRSTTWVKELLGLQAAPEDVKALVRSGSVSSTLAVKALKQDGDQAGKTLTDAVQTAKAAGKTRATAKHTRQRPDPHAELRTLFGKVKIDKRDYDVGTVTIRMDADLFDRFSAIVGLGVGE